MNAADWRAAQAIFERVLSTRQNARQEVLSQECGDDSELFEAVVRLLKADARSRAMVDEIPRTAFRRALEDELAQRWLGRSVGPYKVVEKIGQGGMGQVFLAERVDRTFDKRVAVKVISTATPAAQERFNRERQILADLEHPGIARLLDGGTTPDGLPYVVMELVEGLPLTAFCALRQLHLEERLGLFLEICDAVGFAHQRLIVHRDIKPGNILVDAAGRARLLDFGIAKLLERDGDEAAETVIGDRALTPEYASPEQLSGGAITTASDVYSLGVLLYEMLTGVLPFPSETLSAATATDRHEGRLRLPSAALQPEDGRPPLPPRRLRGDIDNIVLKALRPEPTARYSSVERLAADVRNYLAGLPVDARAPGLGYRASKFVRRHAVAVSLASASALLLTVFTAVTFLQAQRIRTERDVSQQALEFLVDAFESADPRVSLGAEVTAREILARGAERLALDEGPPTEIRAVLARTLGQVHHSLGQHEQARDWLREAAAIETTLHGPDGEHLGAVLRELGETLLQTVEYEEANAVATRAVELSESSEPSSRVRALRTLAEAKAGLSDFDESLDLHTRALLLARQGLQSSDPELVYCLLALSRALGRARRYEPALELIDEGLELQQSHRPGDSGLTSQLLGAAGRNALRSGDVDRARRDIEANFEMNRRIFGEHHVASASALNRLAALESGAGRLEVAGGLYRQSLTSFEETVGPDHPRTIGVRYEYAQFLHMALEDPARAEPVYRRVVESYEKVEGSGTHANLGFFLASHGAVLNDLGRYAEAEPLWRRSWEIRVQRGVRKIRVALAVQLGLGDALMGQRKHAQAEQEYREAWGVLLEEHGLEAPETRRAGESLAKLYRHLGQEPEAREIDELLGSSTQASG